MTYADIPSDSVIRDFVTQYRLTEVPLNFLIAMGLSCVGIMLRRDVWVKHMSEQTLIYPNLSLILIGHSGCGKDTSINFGRRWLHNMGLDDLLVGSRTIEGLYQQLVDRGDPAIGYLPIGEMTATVGTKDYQQGIIQGLTDLMSGNPVVNVSVRSNPKGLIYNPTLTVHAGSTIEWLHKAMPDGSLEGGFLGRFLLVVRDPTERTHHHALPAYEYIDAEERLQLEAATKSCNALAHNIMMACKGRGELHIIADAAEYYENWYHNRYRYFSKAVTPYASRCRDTVLKIAMISAMSRGAKWIDMPDIRLGVTIMQDTAAKIDSVVAPPTKEAQCAAAIMSVLPASRQDLIRKHKDKYLFRDIQNALTMLLESGEVAFVSSKYVRR